MLRPDIQWKNPVMFVVEIGTVLTFRSRLQAIWSVDRQRLTYLIALDVWLS